MEAEALAAQADEALEALKDAALALDRGLVTDWGSERTNVVDAVLWLEDAIRQAAEAIRIGADKIAAAIGSQAARSG